MYNFEPLYGIKSCKLKVYISLAKQNRKFNPKVNICRAILELQFDIDMHGKLYIGNQFGKFQMDA